MSLEAVVAREKKSDNKTSHITERKTVKLISKQRRERKTETLLQYHKQE